MFELMLSGFGAGFSLNILVLVTVGVAVGIVFGAVPGLTAVMAIALCLLWYANKAQARSWLS